MEIKLEFLEPKNRLPNPRWFIPAVIVVIILVVYLFAQAEIAPPHNLWQGLIGEAVSEGYSGMYAVACVYKNRIEKNMPLGCVALKRKDLGAFIKGQGVRYESMAKNIVRKVFVENAPDITGGATHYEAIERYGLPWWAHNMVRTAKIGEHTFFKRLND